MFNHSISSSEIHQRILNMVRIPKLVVLQTNFCYNSKEKFMPFYLHMFLTNEVFLYKN